ncbi:C-C motif chemokine 5-like [Podarcis lilfordi]|uniref:C-C motif chemokine 5-like n=1 Tax=Podarcis lilfordi TaxID=74358 RepID=A0AA35LG18_9SAUR|nr:C-C motif chemokine 5-like [Podarcis lilfordi]
MNLSPAALVFLLFAATFALATACPRVESKYALVGMDPSSPCCKDYSKIKFPKSIVKDYFYTSGNCRLSSVVFVFKNGKTGCADPNAQWAKDLMEYIDSIKHSPSSRPTTVPIPSA